MIRIEDFNEGKSYPPSADAGRIAAVAENRALFNNDVGSLQLDLEEPILKTNLFRRVVTIYTDFLLAEGFTISFPGNSVAQARFDELHGHIADILYAVNTDALRYGTGVVSVDPHSGLFEVFEPDNWFVVEGMDGRRTADILTRVIGTRDQKDQSIEIRFYEYMTPEGTVLTVKRNALRGNVIGESLVDTQMFRFVGRGVAPLFSGYATGQQGVSAFDDLRGVVGDMVRVRTMLTRTISRNLRPHLAAPAGVLSENDEGQINIDTEGMVFPLNETDQKPFYLQWDSNVEAVKFQVQENRRAFHVISGLPPIIFDPSSGAPTSGEALKRLLIPFISKLARIRQNNINLVQMMSVMLNNHAIANGLQQIGDQLPEVEFLYDVLFESSQLGFQQNVSITSEETRRRRGLDNPEMGGGNDTQV